jgi:hypothetical protein
MVDEVFHRVRRHDFAVVALAERREELFPFDLDANFHTEEGVITTVEV